MDLASLAALTQLACWGASACPSEFDSRISSRQQASHLASHIVGRAATHEPDRGVEKTKGLASANLLTLVNSGAGERSRTLDLLITNELLYQLSYTGVSAMPHKWDTAKPAILAQVFGS